MQQPPRKATATLAAPGVGRFLWARAPAYFLLARVAVSRTARRTCTRTLAARVSSAKADFRSPVLRLRLRELATSGRGELLDHSLAGKRRGL